MPKLIAGMTPQEVMIRCTDPTVQNAVLRWAFHNDPFYRGVRGSMKHVTFSSILDEPGAIVVAFIANKIADEDMLERVIRNLPQHPLRPTQKHEGYIFELAKEITASGEYYHWGPPQFSFIKPSVPEGSIRNLRPVFSEVQA